MQRILAKDSPEERARLEKERKTIDRAIAIRDGLIPPPWAEKLFKAASERKAELKSKPEEKRRHPQMDRAITILIEKFGPTGIPPAGMLHKTALATINKEIARQNEGLPENRKEPEMKPDSLRRAILALIERNAP
jgi:hypothetical protein